MKCIKKKGAVELSMTTIIVIVIGVALLSLGLVWIRGVFKQVGSLTKGAFERGEAEIGEIFGESEDPIAIIPTSIELAKAGTAEADVILNNLGSEGADVNLQVESVPKTAGNKVVCAFSDTFESNSGPHHLSSGEGLKLALYLEDKGSTLGRYSCKVTATGLEGAQNFASISVKVVKG